ncbi:MAG: PKD domain-containing protein [Prolixibacteraceae bacterium]|jgi:PKD repeat protein|nr:PKD domain-containing protein [Prolixibacteraceae bacterium]
MIKYGLILIFVFSNLARLSALGPSDICVKSTEGKEFWFGFMENRPGFGCPTPVPVNYLEVTVTSRFNCQFTLTVGRPGTTIITDILQPNIPKKIRIDRSLAEPSGSENIEGKALHLVSDQPLNLYAMNWGYNSADAAVIFPVEALGNEYYAMCYEPHNNDQSGYYAACGISYITLINGKNSEFVVVASEDHTQVTITPSKITDKLNAANIPITITLNKGELYQVQSMNAAGLVGQGDLTGSYIKSDKPVALYSGSWATTVPVSSNSAWDHLYEQIPPLRSWGRKFVAVPLKSRGKDTYRILASVDQTTIRIGSRTPVVIDRGHFHEFMLHDNEASLIESDHPVLLAQYSNSNDVDSPPTLPPDGVWDGDPSMLIISPVDETREQVTFVAYDTPEITNKFFVNIVTRDDAVNQIQLDTNPISFTSLPNTGYAFAQVQIAVGNHNLTSTEAGKGFIAYVYGFGGVESYGYGVGFNLSTRLDLGGDIHFAKDTILLCHGEPKMLDAGPYFSTYLWSTGETSQKISVTHNGTYSVTATTPDGCILNAQVYAFESNPVVNLGADTTICRNPSILLDAGAGFTSYQWSTNASTQKIPVNVTGTYSVLATNKYGCTARDTIHINIGKIPKLNLSMLDSVICGVKSTEVNISTDVGLYSLGSNNPAVSISGLTATVPQFGVYPYTFTATGDYTCAADTNFTIRFQTLPTVDFDLKDNQCLKAGSQSIHYLGNEDDFAKYNWDLSGFLPGEIIKNPGLTKGPLIFDLKYQPKVDIGLQVVSKDGCSSVKKQLRLQRKPDFSVIASDSSGCAPFSLSFSAIMNRSGDQLDYKWDLGNNEIGNGEQFSYTYPNPKQTYDVKIFSESKITGCRDTLLKPQWISVFPKPKAEFSVQDPIQCVNGLFEFHAFDNGQGIQYKWDWGEGNKSTGLNASHAYVADGHYDVSLAVESSHGCTDQLQVKEMVYVAPVPSVGFSLNPESCLDPGRNTLSYNGSASDKDKYYWDLGRLDPIEIIQSPGTTQGPLVFDLINHPTSTVALQVVSQYGCKSESKAINIKRKPIFSFASDVTSGCAPLQVKFEAKSNDAYDLLDYQWDFGDGQTQSGDGILHNYLNPDQSFDILVNAHSKVTGCDGVIDKKQYISVYPNPKAGFSMNPGMVFNDQPRVSFTDESKGAFQYYWDFGDGTRSLLQNPSHDFNSVGIKKIQETVFNEFSCQDTTTKELVVAIHKIFTPNAFSPTARNPEDRQFLLFIEGVKKDGYHLKILSRWNDVVFESKGDIKGWDGRLSNGSMAPVGNYVWILEFTDFLGIAHRQSGTVMLIE